MRTRELPHIVLVCTGLSVSLLGFAPAYGAGIGSAGVGVRLTLDDGHVRIIEVLNGPARLGGLRAGDEITAVDGQSTEGKGLAEVVTAIVGPSGTTVTLTILRADGPAARPFDVALVRGAVASAGSTSEPAMPARPVTPTKAAGPVQWDGDRIVSRVLPYPDLTSLFIRLPIAHAAVTGKGIKAAILCHEDAHNIEAQFLYTAPDAETTTFEPPADGDEMGRYVATIAQDGCRIAVIPDLPAWPEELLAPLAKELLARDILLVIPSDLSEKEQAIQTVHRLHSQGVLTVGRVARDSTVFAQRRGRAVCFNRHIRRIDTDLFCTVGFFTDPNLTNVAGVAAGVAALVWEKWPDMPSRNVREKLIASARKVWQATDIDTGAWPDDLSVDPVTTEYKPAREEAVFRFRVLDAAASVGVDTKIPWPLNMLNCHKAWEITRGQGVIVAVSDQGFHIRHPELAGRIEKTQHFGEKTFDAPDQNFHGTDMSRILLRVAPEARIIPLLCNAPTLDGLGPEIARSLRYAAQERVDVISASWVGRYGQDRAIVSAIEEAVGRGIVVSWFHFPHEAPGILRPSFIYASWSQSPTPCFADRFLTDPPGFHPVEIESGLSGTAPQAAGIAALARSANPGLTPAQITDLILRNSTPIGNNILVPDAYKIVVAAKRAKSSIR